MRTENDAQSYDKEVLIDHTETAEYKNSSHPDASETEPLNSKTARKKKAAKSVFSRVMVGVVLICGLLLVVGKIKTKANANQEKEHRKTYNEMTPEEIEENYASAHVTFKNVDYLPGDQDDIIFVRNENQIFDIATINKDGSGFFDVDLLPGEYKIISVYAETAFMTVESADDEYEVVVDYESMTMSINEMEESKEAT